MTKRIPRIAIAVGAFALTAGLAQPAHAALVSQGTFAVGTSQSFSQPIPEPPTLADGGRGPESVLFWTVVGPAGQPLQWNAPQDFILADIGDGGACQNAINAGTLTGCSDVVRVVNNPVSNQAEIYFASTDDGSSFASLPGGNVPQAVHTLGVEPRFNPAAPNLVLTDTATSNTFRMRFLFSSNANENNAGNVNLVSDLATVEQVVPAVPPVGVAVLGVGLLGLGFLTWRRRSGLNLAQ